MRLAIAMLLAACSPAYADVFDSIHRMELIGPEGACFERIKVENRVGVYNNIERFETINGTVAVEYKTNGGHNTEDDDRFAVIEMPNGVMAMPMEAMIPDVMDGKNGTATICLMIGVS